MPGRCADRCAADTGGGEWRGNGGAAARAAASQPTYLARFLPSILAFCRPTHAPIGKEKLMFRLFVAQSLANRLAWRNKAAIPRPSGSVVREAAFAVALSGLWNVGWAQQINWLHEF